MVLLFLLDAAFLKNITVRLQFAALREMMNIKVAMRINLPNAHLLDIWKRLFGWPASFSFPSDGRKRGLDREREEAAAFQLCVGFNGVSSMIDYVP